MNRFKKWLDTKGITTEDKYPYLPYNGFEGRYIHAENTTYTDVWVHDIYIFKVHRDGIIEMLEDEDDNPSFEDEYASNAPCDNTGICIGTSCPYYFTNCH